MTLPGNYFDAIAGARDPSFGPLVMPWPIPSNPACFMSFDTFAEWRKLVLQCSLTNQAPLTVTSKFERAQKLYLLAWLDSDLVKAGELVALTALELALRDRYGAAATVRRKKLVGGTVGRTKREIAKDEKRNAKTTFADLLKYMVTHDGLTEDQLALSRRCGPPSNVIGLLIGQSEPSLADIRNDLAHGAPLGGFPYSGLLELVRDLIDYAYRDWR